MSVSSLSGSLVKPTFGDSNLAVNKKDQGVDLLGEVGRLPAQGQAAKADRVSLSEEGKKASAALKSASEKNGPAMTGLAAKRPEKEEEKAKPGEQNEAGRPGSEEDEQAGIGAAAGQGGEDDEGGKDDPSKAGLEQKLKELQKKGEKLKEEIDELKRGGAQENSEEINQKEAEKAQISAQINLLTQQMKALESQNE